MQFWGYFGCCFGAVLGVERNAVKVHRRCSFLEVGSGATHESVWEEFWLGGEACMVA